jgi:hypothetical protein
MMQTALHAVGEGLVRVAIGLGIMVFVVLFALIALVTVLVFGQAAAAFGE